MKAAVWVVILTVSCAVLLRGEDVRAKKDTSLRKPASAIPGKTRTNRDAKASGFEADKSELPNKTNSPKPGHPMTIPETRGRTASGNQLRFDRPSVSGAIVGKGPSTFHPSRNTSASSILHSGGSLPTVTTFKGLPHRGPYSAVLGGMPNSRTATAGMITGNRMNHKL
jgi:hypothetical protein